MQKNDVLYSDVSRGLNRIVEIPEHTDPPEVVGRMTFRQILTPRADRM